MRKKRSAPKRKENSSKHIPLASDLGSPSLFLNRELSWLQFNRRIFNEVLDSNQPLLERLKFLAICGSNLDEFFMVRVSGLRRQLRKGVLKAPPDGMTPSEQLAAIRREMLSLLQQYRQCWKKQLLPELAANGISFTRIKKLPAIQRKVLRHYFKKQIFPTVTPLAMDMGHPFPFISNLCLNLLVIMRDKEKEEKYARIKVPLELFDRFIPVSSEGEGCVVSRSTEDRLHPQQTLVFLEDLLANNLDLLFPGLKIIGAYPFRVTRDAEVEISLDQAADLLTAMEEGIETRRLGKPIRLQVDHRMPKKLRKFLGDYLGIQEELIYSFAGPLRLSDFWQLLRLDRPDLKDTSFHGFIPPSLVEGEDVFAAIRKRDQLLFHPYDSFTTTINFLQQAATDPQVLAIKIALYRIANPSPIINALLMAKQNGKAVAALVELKAKFDEENNIVWARSLEEAGVHVVYGLLDLKVHCKALLVIRREEEEIVHYVHLSSGNYNNITAHSYGDLAYLTANQEIGHDVANLFNSLTGYSRYAEYHQLLVAPRFLRQGIISRIEREIVQHQKSGQGYLAFKLNGLLDKAIIQALYRASMAGVKVDINVRGICALCPGIPEISENIRVISIVGRFLEHSRIYYFRNGGEEEVLLGSADLMPRNLDKRVETLFPVLDDAIRSVLINQILKIHLQDTHKAYRLCSDGNYEMIAPTDDQEPFSSQQWFIDHRGCWHEEDDKSTTRAEPLSRPAAEEGEVEA
ncbi:MAG: polyphosphate kinase 1 [Xanthomonadaceae bacterium]|nr:polyphosphate kinase 1 [Xanthomonadaceae bacterium]